MTNTCFVTFPNGKKYAVFYYKLHAFCNKIIENFLNDTSCTEKERWQRKRAFMEFRRQYKTFDPAFDFVFQYLGYTLTNPFLISDSTLVSDQDVYYISYHGNEGNLKPFERQELQAPIWVTGKEENLIKKPISMNYQNLEESFISPNLEQIKIKHLPNLHNTWARMWVHEGLIKDKNIFLEYCFLASLEKDTFFLEQSSILTKYFPYIQFGISYMPMNPLYIFLYKEELMSSKQKAFLKDIQMRSLKAEKIIEKIM